MTAPAPSASSLAATPAALAGRRVLVLGLGESGLAMARHALACGAEVGVADTRERPPALGALVERHPRARWMPGRFDASLLDEADVVGVSPGLSIERGPGQAMREAAMARGLPVVGELDLFVAALQAHAGPPARVVAVTGTNGKTTVTALTALLLRAAGRRAVAAGNIGPAMLDAWQDALAGGEMPEVWVLELSSFQLAIARPLAPDAAAILNITQDHLDWHAGFDAYVAAKARIVGAGGTLVCRRDDPLTRAAGASRIVDIGLDEPLRPGSMGMRREGGIDWLVEAVADDDGLPRRRGAPAPEVRLNRLMPAEALRLNGAHNHLNAMAALALARAVDTPMAGMLHALRDYRGEPHRCQHIARLDGVDFFDDSKGTNVGATVAALEGLGRRCWLIAGGQGKGQDFAPLAGPVRAHAAGVCLIGEAADALSAALASAAPRLHRCAGMDEAVRVAAEGAAEGEAVLLSPACASFDMFADYRDRARAFSASVRDLAVERGIVLELPC